MRTWLSSWNRAIHTYIPCYAGLGTRSGMLSQHTMHVPAGCWRHPIALMHPRVHPCVPSNYPLYQSQISVQRSRLHVPEILCDAFLTHSPCWPLIAIRSPYLYFCVPHIHSCNSFLAAAMPWTGGSA